MSNPKPDQYMPFAGNSFFAATSGMSDDIAMKYLRAIWYYWHHNGCKGLINDDEFLRNICRCDRADWEISRQLIFDSGDFFQKENGLWQQSRARKEYHKSLAIIISNKAKTEAARQNRWKK